MKDNKKNTTVITIEDNCPIPLESLAILVNGEDNKSFKVLSKHISTDSVKITLRHKKTNQRVKLLAPIEFLEFHKILYKEPVVPNDKQIIGTLDGELKLWEVEHILKDLFKSSDLVILKCSQSGKIIACKIDTALIEKTKDYLEKSINYKQANYNYNQIKIWRETECQREIQVRQNLSQLTSSTAQTKA